MQQKNLHTPLKNALSQESTLQTAFLIGSQSRQTADFFADTDLLLLTSANFSPSNLVSRLKEVLQKDFWVRYDAITPKKIVLYGEHFQKIDLIYTSDTLKFKRWVAQAEVVDYQSAIWFDRAGLLTPALEPAKPDHKTSVAKWLSAFVVAFELASNAQAAGDGYRFYYHYNSALHHLVQLKRLLSVETLSESWMPRNFVFSVLQQEDIPTFLEMNAVTNLAFASEKKRKLLLFFYDTLAVAESKDYLDTSTRHKTVNFCESLFERDFFWNFRDASLINPRLKKGLIYRTSSLTRYQNLEHFEDFVRGRNILRAVDLRSYPEVEQQPYSADSQELFEHIHIPMDHRKHMDVFRADNMHGNAMVLAYSFFMKECKAQIKSVMEVFTKNPKGATAIHCFAGKDRTGIILSLLHLISGANIETAAADYLASRMDTSPLLFSIFTDALKEHGGHESYLLSCGLSSNDMQAIKTYISEN